MTRTLALALATLLACAAPAFADPPLNDTSRELRRAVGASGIAEHLVALHRVARSSTGNRLAGTPGYDASAEYVAQRAREAGLDTSFAGFEYDLFALADWQRPVLDVQGGPSFVPGIAGALQAATSGPWRTRPRAM